MVGDGCDEAKPEDEMLGAADAAQGAEAPIKSATWADRSSLQEIFHKALVGRGDHLAGYRRISPRCG